MISIARRISVRFHTLSIASASILSGSIDHQRLRKMCEDTAGLTLGLGLDPYGSGFRIGHMGHLNPPMILGTIATIESALRAMDAPIGTSGVAAATEVIGRAMTTMGGA